MHKPKIAIIGEKFFPSRGGTSRVIEDILIQLKDRYDFTMYCYPTAESKDYMPGVEVVEIPKMPFKSLGVFYYFYLCTRDVIKKGNFDLVHVHKTDLAIFLPWLCRHYPTIATSHEAPYRRDKWSFLGKFYFRMMERIFMRSKAHLTSISKPLSAYYQQKYSRPVAFIPNGVDIDVVPNFELANEVLNRNNIHEPFIFFAARRIMASKGCHHLLIALKMIGFKGKVVIAGDTSQLPAYTKYLEELSEGLDVSFVGYLSRKPKLMALIKKADYFIFPSESEGMSIMFLEVASMNTPIIASDIPENTSVLSENEVLYFTNKDPNDLAEKLRWAFANREEMEKKAVNARKRIEQDYDRVNVAELYAQLYDTMLSKKVSTTHSV